MSLIDQINTHQYLYLEKLLEADDLKLEIWLSEAGGERDFGNSNEGVSSFGAIESDEFSKKYKITFERYVSYSVRNESFTVRDDYERSSGNLFRVYSKSRFLDYIGAAVEMFLVEQTQTEGVKHFGILCLNHIIDVATCEGVKVEEI